MEGGHLPRFSMDTCISHTFALYCSFRLHILNRIVVPYPCFVTLALGLSPLAGWLARGHLCILASYLLCGTSAPAMPGVSIDLRFLARGLSLSLLLAWLAAFCRLRLGTFCIDDCPSVISQPTKKFSRTNRFQDMKRGKRFADTDMIIIVVVDGTTGGDCYIKRIEHET
jgi:hypothetical protein